MANQPRLTDIDIWASHEQLVLRVLRAALPLLAYSPPGGNEDNHNRALYKCMLHANRALRKAGEPHFDHPPAFESKPAPGAGAVTSPPELKRPDFAWCYIDHSAADAGTSSREFAVEGKLLGEPANPRNLAAEYMDKGIRRFLDGGHRYGESAASGAMVGYVRDATFVAVEEQVAEVAAQRAIPPLERIQKEEADEHAHHLNRPFPVTPYRLTHLWVDAGSAKSQAKPSTRKTTK